MSLRIESELVTGNEIADALGVTNEARTSDIWVVGFRRHASESLDVQLHRAREFLQRHLVALMSLPSPCEVRLFASWSPRVGQRAMTFDAELIQALALVGGHVWFDVHADRELP